MFYQIFLSPQVKRWAIITYKHGIYELPHELPNYLRLRSYAHTRKKKTWDLRKLGNIRKVSKPHRMIAQRPAPPPSGKIKILLALAKEPQNTATKPSPRCATPHENLKFPATDCTPAVMLQISINLEEFQLEESHLAYSL